MKVKLYIAIAILLLTLLISSCAAGNSGHNKDYRAGFFRGIWHGWIAPVSLIWHFFNPQVRIYEVHNTGWSYDFGFYIAVISGFGGLSLSRKKKCKKKE